MVGTVAKSKFPEKESNRTDIDMEKQVLDTAGDPVAYSRQQRKKKSTFCCIFLPWVMFLLCFILLAGAMHWGWQQHRQLECLKAKIKNMNTLPLIPYGNDAIMPVEESQPMAPDQDPIIFEMVFGFNNEDLPQDGGSQIGPFDNHDPFGPFQIFHHFNPFANKLPEAASTTEAPRNQEE